MFIGNAIISYAKILKITRTIEEQITFTKDYLNLGVSASAW